ncbi:MAG: type I-D CRISPR-associated protein Cas7/Csc2 [bacterium]|jgi:CRISPR type I-D-associated protein Csc2
MSIREKLSKYLVEKPHPLIGAQTIQLLIFREVLDYTVLRTEETRELNWAHTPLSENNRDKVVKRVAFLGTKQKAAESRQLEYLLRSAAAEANKEIPECYLKDNLCLRCPRCGLFGATSLGEAPNIKHRIEYSTAFSLLPFELVADEITFNAVGEKDQRTGQALGSRHVVKPATLFPSIIGLKSVTWEELVLTVKTLLSCMSYGAESRIGGDCRNTLFGVVAGWEEVITPLELTLELYDQKENLDPARLSTLINEKYRTLAGNPDQVVVLSTEEVDELVRACTETPLDRVFLDKAYEDVAEYRATQGAKK